MEDQISIKLGSLPWEPAPDAVLAKTFNYHDQPLIGVIEQGDNRYVFQCLEGHLEALSLWAFTPASAEELSRLEQAKDFDFELEQLGLGHPAAIAMLKEGDGIVWTEYLSDARPFGSLKQAAIAAHKSIGNDLETLLPSK